MQINYNNGYQNWKNVINNVLIYKHTKQQLQEQNKNLRQKIIQIQKSPNRDQETQKEYLNLIKQLFSNYKQINEKIAENLKNKQLLEQLYKEHNIKINYDQFEKWIKEGKKIS